MGGRGVYGLPEYWTAERRREVATELTVLKIAKSKIPGTLVAVGCGSGSSGEDRKIRQNMECWVPMWGKGREKYDRQVRYPFQLI